MKRLFSICFCFLFSFSGFAQKNTRSSNEIIPHLQKNGTAVQLMVEGKPFLMLGGELGNSSASSAVYMRPIWPKLKEMHLNTVLAPVYWELLEPEEDKFDFQMVDSLLEGAREHDMKLVLLWFGSWKNSMSSYAPIWIKTDQKRFPRAQDPQGKGMEILSPFSSNNLNADKKAFAALMNHLSEVDEAEQTVIMVQVENEVGMIPEARDYTKAANEAFKQEVPQDLIQYLQKHQKELHSHVKALWKANGSKTRGNWEELFGKSLHTDELFMAWHFGQYTNQIAEAGKKAYALPMYVNAALNRPQHKPGQYPSAGPLPHLVDVWKVAAPKIDFLSPDLYFPDYANWISQYYYPNNPLFVPEVRLGSDNGAQAYYTIGRYNALGFSPFSIESTEKHQEASLTKTYDLLAQLSPLLLEKQTENKTFGVLLNKEAQSQQIDMGNYTLTISHDYTLGWTPEAKEAGPWPSAGGIIVATGPDDFVVAGEGLVITVESNSKKDPLAGFASIYEGEYEDGSWKPGRSMNGDQSHQGRHVRIPQGTHGIQQVKLYQYN